MNAPLLTALALGFVVGYMMGCWRTMVYARKLIHFAVNLDQWCHYDPQIRQARGQESKAPAQVILAENYLRRGP